MAYFRVPLLVAEGIAAADPDPQILAAWLVLRCYSFGNARDLTATGAKKIAWALGISRRSAAKLLQRLLAIRYGERGDVAVVMTAADWNQQSGNKVPTQKGLMPVYVMPDPGCDCAYLPNGLVAAGNVRSRLADLCDLDDPQAGLDAIRALIQLYHATSFGDFCGADPDLFASCNDWVLEGNYAGHHDLQLGAMEHYLGGHQDDAGRRYWLAKQGESLSASWVAIEAVTGGRTGACVERFRHALGILEQQGLMSRVAIVLNARGQLLYPLWAYGELSRSRLDDFGVAVDLARVFQRRAEEAGMVEVECLAAEAGKLKAEGERETGLFVCATKTAAVPIIRTVYAPTLFALTPDSLKDLSDLAGRTWKWL